MKRQFNPTVVVTMVMLVCGAALAAAEQPYREAVEMSYPMAADGRVSLDNVNGDVKVVVWEQAEVRIEAIKRASSKERLEGLKIEVDASESSVRVHTRYPKSRDSGSASVEYTLTVPRQASIDALELVNGSIEIEGVEGGIEAESVNGTITARRIAGGVEMSTVNGGMDIYHDLLRVGDTMELESVNGHIDLYLATSVDASVEAETVNGRLTNDFDLQVNKHKHVGADFSGVIGAGGAKIELSTVNGAISLHSY